MFVLRGAVAARHIGSAFVLMFGHPAGHSRPPVLKGTRFERRAHQTNHVSLGETVQGFNCLKRGAILPGHLNKA